MNGSRAWFEKDFYSVLGVSEGATAQEIKRAYKKLAQRHHPDRNPGDRRAEETMKDASEAYDVLSDAKKRKEYDQVRRLARSGFVGGGPGTGWESTIHFEDIPFDLGEMFGEMFGGARARRAARRGPDVSARVRIPFEDAIRGTTVEVRSGGERFKVKIPPGIRDGARVRVSGRGAEGAAGRGDLYVGVEIAPHEMFGRREDDLTVTVPVSFADAALGGTVTVPTLEGGSVTVKLPPGTQPGRTFRVRGRGAPRGKDGAGDLLVTVQVTVPAKLSREQRELIEKLSALDGARARTH